MGTSGAVVPGLPIKRWGENFAKKRTPKTSRNSVLLSKPLGLTDSLSFFEKGKGRKVNISRRGREKSGGGTVRRRK